MESEIYEKAHAIMTNRRNQARLENDERIAEINSKIPQIKEINAVLFSTGKELIQLVVNSKGRNIEQRLEEIKRRNIEAQNMAKQLLVSYGYPEDYLDIHYSCPICNDTGYIDTEFCGCMKSLFGKLMTEKLNSNSHVALSSFDTFRLSYYTGENYNIMKRFFEYTKDYAENFTLNADNILMSGDTGLGKTHLSLSIANTVIQRGFNVLYDSSINILRNIEREHYSYEHSTDVIDSVFDADLLIIDDLGTEQESKFNIPMIYNIVNTRLTRSKPTIISTNLDLKTISERYGGKVSSRIATLYKVLLFRGDDIRLKIFMEKNKK